MSCDLCQKFGVTCEDVGILFFKRRAIFIGDVQTHEGLPISKCSAVIDNAKIPEVAKQIVDGGAKYQKCILTITVASKIL